MLKSSRKFIVRLLLLLGAGLAIGWLYGSPLVGLLGASILALFFQVQRLLAFDKALYTRNFDAFRYGEGIWQRIYSRLAFERERGRRYKRQYRQLLKEIRKSTNAMPDGAIVLDSNCEIIACNRAATRLAGFKRKKDRGQRVDNILRDPGVTRLLHAPDSDESVDIASPIQDGSWLNCRVVPYGLDQKLLLIRDVTERMRLNRMRRDFFANASHELRSPLTVISGYLESMLGNGDIDADMLGPLQQMQAQSSRMTKIVNELLELSRLESAGRAGKEDAVDVPGLLAAARNAHVSRANSPNIELRAESSAKLLGNSGEIESVITNLLSNALRHTPDDGEITMIWRSGADGADLVVRDTGEGIAEEYIPRLTERFFRVDRGRAREDGGVGLGLAIVKHVLNRHDAELVVSSQPGVGSEFRCHFPAARIVMGSAVPIKTQGGQG